VRCIRDGWGLKGHVRCFYGVVRVDKMYDVANKLNLLFMLHQIFGTTFKRSVCCSFFFVYFFRTHGIFWE
jgi:hypothetical protein